LATDCRGGETPAESPANPFWRARWGHGRGKQKGPNRGTRGRMAVERGGGFSFSGVAGPRILAGGEITVATSLGGPEAWGSSHGAAKPAHGPAARGEANGKADRAALCLRGAPASCTISVCRLFGKRSRARTRNVSCRSVAGAADLRALGPATYPKSGATIGAEWIGPLGLSMRRLGLGPTGAVISSLCFRTFTKSQEPCSGWARLSLLDLLVVFWVWLCGGCGNTCKTPEA